MAFREVDMWEVLQILRLLGRGQSKSAIKRATGADRKTIRNYEAVAQKLGWSAELGTEPTEELAGQVFALVRPGPEPSNQTRIENLLSPYRRQLKQWLSDQPGSPTLLLTKVHQLLIRRGVTVGYSSLRRYVVKHCGYRDRRRITVRMAPCEPGEVAEIDFGQMGRIFDPISGRTRVLHGLIVTLVYSRHQYVHMTFSQKLPDVIEGLDNAWRYFGGVVRRVIVDNMKTAVVKSSRYEPVFNRTFAEYATHCGFVIDAAVARHPKGKPHVERNVPYVRGNFFQGETWGGREHVQEAVTRWCTETAGMRTHGTTHKKPLVVFRDTEQPALLPVPSERFDTPEWGQCKVHPDHRVTFLKSGYTVPTKYIGKEVTVRADSGLVRIYCEGQVIKTHVRQKPGHHSIDHDDFPAELTPYTTRDPDRVIRNARKRGVHVGQFAANLLTGDFPWAKLRQGQALLRLADKYGNQRCDQACRRALAFDLVNVNRVKRIILNDLASQPVPAGGGPAQIIQLPLRFARDAGSFAHNPQHEGDHDDRGGKTITGNGSETIAPVRHDADPAGSCRLRPESQSE